MITAGCDLGMKNFAISIVRKRKNTFKILHAKMVKNLVTSMKENVLEQRFAFYMEIKKVLVKYRPTELIAERFMVRGRFGGSIAECLNFMIGTLAGLCHKLKIKFRAITASQWKNSFQHAMNKKLIGLYKYLKPLPPHIVDSALQATYGITPKYEKWSIDYLKQLRSRWK